MYGMVYSGYGRRMAKAVKTPVSLRLTKAELELLDRVSEAQFEGNKTAAFVAGLHSLENGGRKTLSRAQLMAEIDRRLK